MRTFRGLILYAFGFRIKVGTTGTKKNLAGTRCQNVMLTELQDPQYNTFESICVLHLFNIEPLLLLCVVMTRIPCLDRSTMVDRRSKCNEDIPSIESDVIFTCFVPFWTGGIVEQRWRTRKTLIQQFIAPNKKGILIDCSGMPEYLSFRYWVNARTKCTFFQMCFGIVPRIKLLEKDYRFPKAKRDGG